MPDISTQNLKVGMVVAKHIYSPKGQLILPQDSILSGQMISRLKYYQIPSIPIHEGGLPEKAKELIELKNEVRQNYTDRLIHSPVYRKFVKHYHFQVRMVENSINDLIIKNVPLNSTELIRETIELFDDNPTAFSIFGMLHNMQELDDSTSAHCVNVSVICRLMGTWLQMDPDDLDALTLSGLLHDIGKAKIPEDILLKPSKLSKQEYEFIKLHPQFGYDILKDQDIDPRVKKAVLLHHERCDGSGYPLGLHGDEIDDFASIVAIADVYDAMTSDRCYRNGLCPFDVIAAFEDEGVNRYNPKFILPFLKRIANSYVNSKVLLNDHTIARIIFITEQPTRPMLQTESGEILDLTRHPDLYIEAIV